MTPVPLPSTTPVIDPSRAAESKTAQILAVLTVFHAIALITVSLRIYVRTVLIRALGKDDLLMVASVVWTSSPFPWTQLIVFIYLTPRHNSCVLLEDGSSLSSRLNMDWGSIRRLSPQVTWSPSTAPPLRSPFFPAFVPWHSLRSPSGSTSCGSTLLGGTGGPFGQQSVCPLIRRPRK